MSGLVVKTAVVPNSPVVAEAIVVNDGWFPDIDPVQLRKEYRIRDSVTAERLRKAIVGAILKAGNQLEAWQTARAALVPTGLVNVPAKTIDGQSRYLLLYQRAIGSYAKAELVEEYRDTDTTTAGQRDVDDLEPSISELRRDGLYAIRDILGRPRVRSELV